MDRTGDVIQAMKADPAAHTKENLDTEVAKLKVQPTPSSTQWGFLLPPLIFLSLILGAGCRSDGLNPSLVVPAMRHATRHPHQELKAKADDPMNALEDPVTKAKYTAVRSVGEECVADGELAMLLSKKPDSFVLYDGFEPSGRMHIAQVCPSDVRACSQCTAGPHHMHACRHSMLANGSRLPGLFTGRDATPPRVPACRGYSRQ
jgi:hypothetical protein